MNSQELDSLLSSKVPAPAAFQPMAHYDADGDCIEFIAAPDSFYAERIDPLITVYRSQQSNEIVGSLIKGVSKFLRGVLQRAPGFRIEVQDGRMKLTYLFTAKLWTEAMDPNAVPGVIYRKLRERAEETDAEVDVGDLALA